MRTPISDLVIAVLASGAAVIAWRPLPVVFVVVVAVAWATARLSGEFSPRRIIIIAIVIVILVGGRSASSRQQLASETGMFTGWGKVVDDPQQYRGTTRIIVELKGKRYEIWGRGRAMQTRLSQWRGGQRVRVSGLRRALDAERQGRVAWQHVVGEFELDWVGDVMYGSGVERASNRVRMAIERSATTLPGDDGSLFRGLVIGDDRDQPFEMIDRFRASGLSHLTAVSGQNVAFVLAAAGPLLRMMRPSGRWLVTLGLIAWFVALTRFEPSIVRAGVMAALSATAFTMGQERSPLRILALAVTALMIVDPLLVGSVGLWLSVGATAGVVTIGLWIAARIECLGILAMPTGITLGAQLGVALPALLVFGRLPLVSIPANLLAAPIAGFVMLYGLPAGLLAGVIPAVAPVVMFPCRLGVRWVDVVAHLAARLEPQPSAAMLGWILVVALVAASALRRNGAWLRR